MFPGPWVWHPAFIYIVASNKWWWHFWREFKLHSVRIIDLGYSICITLSISSHLTHSRQGRGESAGVWDTPRLSPQCQNNTGLFLCKIRWQMSPPESGNMPSKSESCCCFLPQMGEKSHYNVRAHWTIFIHITEKGGRFSSSLKNKKLHRMWIIREIVRKGCDNNK